MKGKIKAVLLTACVFMLSSCGVFDNKSNTQQAENFQLSSVNVAYDGIDELMGKDMGSVKLPDTIIVQDISELYTFSAKMHHNEDSQTNKEFALKLYSDFFKESFEPEECEFDSLGYFYMYYDEGKELARYADGQMSLVRKDYEVNLEEEFQRFYRADSDERISVGNSECSVKEIAAAAKDFLDNELPTAFNGFVVEPQDVFIRRNGDKNVVNINCVQKLHGIPFEDYPTVFTQMSKDSSGNDTITTYYATDIRMGLDDKDSIAWVHIDKPVEITKKEKLEKMISLKDAVDILHKELSELTVFKFDEVKLMYCCKQTYIDYYYGDMTFEQQLEKTNELNEQEHDFYPTWCFIADNELSGYSRWIVKLNAVTGEITIDAPDGIAGQKE